MKLEISVQDETNIRFSFGSRVIFGTVQADPLRMRTVRLFRSWLESDQFKDREGLEVLGSHLYEIIFNKDIVGRFEDALKDARGSKESLRVKLIFQEAALTLANLPWEFLYKPDSETGNGYFLSTKTELTLFRFMPRDTSAPSKPAELKVLVVLAEPGGSGANAPTAPQKITQEMMKLFKDLGVTADYLENPTAVSLPATIDKFQPHVLHFIGHGLMDKKSNKSQIAILDDNAHLQLVPDTLFAQYVHNSGDRDLRLVFLHLTECKHPAEINLDENYASFAGMATALIKNADIPAVLAMQFPLKPDVATKFCSVFYSELANSKDIDAAVQTIRSTIHLTPAYWDTHVFGTPVLSVFQDDMMKFELFKDPSKKTPTPIDQQGQNRAAGGPEAGGASVTPAPARATDPGDLRKLAVAEMDKLELSEAQRGVIGRLTTQLYQEKKAAGNYKDVLDNAMGENADWQVQQVIDVMRKGLGA